MDNEIEKSKEREKEVEAETEKYEKEKRKKKIEELKEYLRVSVAVGGMIGVSIGWMWGIKGMLLGPVIGMGVCGILSLIFTFYDKNFWVHND